MRTIKLTIEYDGTAYVGWQHQPNGISVQQVVEESLAGIQGESIRIHSSGRTDSGVHARGMVACFRTVRVLPMTAYTEGMNCTLPPDIAIISAEEVHPEFDPRRHAKGKHYRYTVRCSTRRSPLARLQAWYLKEKLDLERMREGAAFFIGEHDFSAFRTSGCAAKTTVKRIDSVVVSALGDLIHIDVCGSGFMRNMVRIMAGTLIQIGLGKMQPEHVRKCLTEPGATPGPTAPAHGLCLMEVYY
jgi:tRNA pseudouridine38-40 synthase